MVNQPHVIIIAGPNGAGKSTTAPHLLKDLLGVTEFVNADVIAQGLSAFATEAVAFQAGRFSICISRWRINGVFMIMPTLKALNSSQPVVLIKRRIFQVHNFGST
jgi:predicted ABC-type ATPase